MTNGARIAEVTAAVRANARTAAGRKALTFLREYASTGQVRYLVRAEQVLGIAVPPKVARF